MIERHDDRARFAPGTTVVLREVLDGRIRSARPLRIVADDVDGVVGYLVPRSTVAWPRLLDGAQSQTPDQGWLLPEEEWFGPGSLYVVPAGAGYAAVLFFDRDTGEPLSWKVDFFRPLARTGVGFDTLDHALDLLVTLDRRSWQPKDLDDAAQLRRVAVLDRHELAALDAERARVEDLLRRRAAPFDDRWPTWRPDPTWPPLRLPQGWDHLEGTERPATATAAGHAGSWRSAGGIEVLTAAGTRLFDLDLAGGSLPCGHAHPAVVEAVTRQAALGWALGDDHPAVERLRTVLLHTAMVSVGRAGGDDRGDATGLADRTATAPRATVHWYRSGTEAAAAATGVAATVTPPGAGPGVVVDLRGRLIEGWPPPALDPGSCPDLPVDAHTAAAAVVFGDDLFGGFGGGALVVLDGLDGLDGLCDEPPRVGALDGPPPTTPHAVAAIAALETIEQLRGDGPASAARLAARLRDTLALPGTGAGFRLPADLVAAAAEVGVHVAPSGAATLATVTTPGQAAEIIERLRPILTDPDRQG